jgi:hypothetical protein
MNHGFIAIVLVAGCWFGMRASTGGKDGLPGRDAWRLLEPVQYENLLVFPVVSSQSADTGTFATLDDALGKGDAVVTESGSNVMRRSRGRYPTVNPAQQGDSVNQLVLINRGSKPLVLLAGEMVSGGKQDRIIAEDRIVPAGAEPIPLDVFCVEEGRWSAGEEFSSGKMMVHPSVREKAAVDREQTQVWAAVRKGTTSESAAVGSGSGGAIGGGAFRPPRDAAGGGRGGIDAQTVTVTAAPVTVATISAIMVSEAPTHSYQKIYKSARVGNAADPFIEQVQKRFARSTAHLKGESVVGVVVAYGGEVAWSDIFASHEMFERYWPKLLRSYVVEALARPQTREQASLDDAREFLRPLTGHESTESESGAYQLRQVTQGRYVEIELEALAPADIKLHTLKIHRTS